MEILKKKHTEIVALYKLETNIKDIYVEGPTDKFFLESYLKNKNGSRKIFQVEVIDFSQLDDAYYEGYDKTLNKIKVAILSKLLCDKAPESETKCIVDKDFDDFIKSIQNDKLLKTDFSCLESYLFCEEVLDKFLKIGINNFPFEATFILSELALVLKPLFCIRLIRELHFKDKQLVTIDGNLSINKQNGTINFNPVEYLDKFINKNSLTKEKAQIHQQYDALMKKLNLEIRHYINGHDFLDIFFLYINKIKNTLKYKEEHFGRVLFLTVESSMVEKYQLFKNLSA